MRGTCCHNSQNIRLFSEIVRSCIRIRSQEIELHKIWLRMRFDLHTQSLLNTLSNRSQFIRANHEIFL